MCSPNASNFANGTAGAGAALQIGSAVAGFIGQNRAAQANARRAITDQARKAETLGERSIQIEQQAAEALVSNALESARVRASARASAATSGLSGNTTRAVLQGIGAETGRAASIIEANRDNRTGEIDESLRNLQTDTQRRIDSVRTGSPLNLALQIGAAGANAAATVA